MMHERSIVIKTAALVSKAFVYTEIYFICIIYLFDMGFGLKL